VAIAAAGVRCGIGRMGGRTPAPRPWSRCAPAVAGGSGAFAVPRCAPGALARRAAHRAGIRGPVLRRGGCAVPGADTNGPVAGGIARGRPAVRWRPGEACGAAGHGVGCRRWHRWRTPGRRSVSGQGWRVALGLL